MSTPERRAGALPDTDVLAGWLARQRWFAAKTRRIAGVRTRAEIPLANARVAVLEVTLDDGAVQGYLAPLGAGPGAVDALEDPRFCRALLELMATGGRITGAGAQLRGHAVVPELLDLPAETPARRLGAEQSNTSVLFGRALLLKFFRRHVLGTNPEIEIGRFLTERGFPATPRLAGHLELRGPGGTADVAIVQEFVGGARDGWEWMLEQLAEFYAEARSIREVPSTPRVLGLAAPALTALHRLGLQTGALHQALASDTREPAFAPAPITGEDLAAWSAAIREQVAAARRALGAGAAELEAPAAHGLGHLLGRQKIRHHGDFHLGQTLYRPDVREFVLIDFEGEPVRPLDERRRLHAAVRDVAGLLRSLEYAAAAAARPEGGGDELAPWAERWIAEARRAFLGGYRATAAGAEFVPASDTGFLGAVAAFELEKAAYEVVYEANHRPDWLDIPRRGLLAAAARLREAGV